MKDLIQSLLSTAAQTLHADGVLSEPGLPESAVVTRTKDPSHGDFASNAAMVLAKAAKMPPRQLAEKLLAALPNDPSVDGVEIAGPGFINFRLAKNAATQVLKTILSAGENYGRTQLGNNQYVQLEFVSANPTGPLHVGHGRGAAAGASLGNILDFAGYNVYREYYVNDAGRQMDILATSTWLRYIESFDGSLPFPSNGYQGDYIRETAAEIKSERGDTLVKTVDEIFLGVPADAPAGGDKEAHIDGLIANAKALLGDRNYRYVFDKILNVILDDIRDDLAEFGVTYDNWFSERSLFDSGEIDEALEELTTNGHTYTQDGVLWFKSTEFGDEKDRALRRANGMTTYFASDAAYIRNKFKRGFEHLLYLFGADHHGYVPRMKALALAFGFPADNVEFRLVQFAVLFRNGEKVQMSTRSGQFDSLRQLRDEVSSDAARYFYAMRSLDQHMDFDMDLAVQRSSDNPMYYAQYAHARVCAIFRQAESRGVAFDADAALKQLEKLDTDADAELLKQLARFPEAIDSAAKQRDVHPIPNYLRELSQAFHAYYNINHFLVDDADLTQARLLIAKATQQVLANGLKLVGVSAPESM